VAFILIQLDEATLKSLRRIVPGGKERRAEFISRAVREAVRRREYEQIRQAYMHQPDTATEADYWLNAEEWK
jgi:metal-responsive CopG/Arc/MetJ family transcriptional regulator